MKIVRLSIVIAVRDGVEDAEAVAELTAALNAGHPAWGGVEVAGFVRETPAAASKTRKKELTCERCGNTFLAVRSDAKYCSHNCRVATFAAGHPGYKQRYYKHARDA